ncbi:guanylate kinase [bacterium]|nr:MAG: guanylate kinase [bacterium]
MSGKGILFVISSTSGGGKTTLVRRMLESLPDLALSVSHTTRDPREGEVDGSDYHFIDRDEFEKIRESGGFLEWAEVYGEYYGTSSMVLESVREQLIDTLLDIDVQGGCQIRDTVPEAVLIFVIPPERDELIRRLRSRGTESPTQLERRLSIASEELALMPIYDYAVLNEDLEGAVQALRSIIIAERCRVTRRPK